MPVTKMRDFRVCFRLLEEDYKIICALSDNRTSSYSRVIVENHIREMKDNASKRRISEVTRSDEGNTSKEE